MVCEVVRLSGLSRLGGSFLPIQALSAFLHSYKYSLCIHVTNSFYYFPH